MAIEDDCRFPRGAIMQAMTQSFIHLIAHFFVSCQVAAAVYPLLLLTQILEILVALYVHWHGSLFIFII